MQSGLGGPFLQQGTLVVWGSQHAVQDGAGPAGAPGMLGGKAEDKSRIVCEGSWAFPRALQGHHQGHGS